jgi:uncharacterized membrane protein YfcA
MDVTWLAVAGALLAASFVKGTTGMGFPLIATPMVAMVVDLRTTYALLLLPNILMDTIQIVRGEHPWHLWRRLLPLLASTAAGVFVGTRIFLSVSDRVVYALLAATIVAFLASKRARLVLAVPPRWEGWIGVGIGFAGGVLTGITNIVGPLVALYLLALQFEKTAFVKGVASVFLTAKLTQFAAISQGGIYSLAIFRWSALLTAAGLMTFWIGLKTQDRVPQETFLKILYAILTLMAAFFLYRLLLGVEWLQAGGRGRERSGPCEGS